MRTSSQLGTIFPEQDEPHDCHIVIVGGGTAGWMSAATLKRRVGCRVTVVESDRVPPIGVGEATIPAMVDWIENMGIDEDEFIRRTGATYKLAIRFDDWIEPSHRYWHPFGICGCSIEGVDLIHAWQRGVREGWLPNDSQYTDYSFQKELCDHGCGPRQPGMPSIAENYAFHLDAGKLAVFLREVALAEGVQHRVGDVEDAPLDEHGNIACLCLADGSPLQGNLYVDCTGFASVMIENAMNSPWEDWSEQLICDRAITFRIAGNTSQQDDGAVDVGRRALAPYTISTGMNAGWSWQIPLAENTGCGYVFSSKHISDEAAKSELCALVGADPDMVSAKTVPMRIGMRPRQWIGNCVSIGLSAGFVEPLESTGIFLVQRALDELFECLPPATPLAFHAGHFDHATFNGRMTEVYRQVRDFVLMHYVVSRRRDTPFWIDAATVDQPESLRGLLDEYVSTGRVRLPQRDPTFAEANHHFILSPAGVRAGTHEFGHPGESPAIPGVPAGQYQPVHPSVIFDSIRASHRELCAALPAHDALIQSIHGVKTTCDDRDDATHFPPKLYPPTANLLS
ncbi:tryptophan halogenase family protein [Rhodopirellula sallentina]|uniref:Tryptophan halogenase PrnA n=1 Tax=Rhodopirellula sallentina SM41 TaxID=1263870 RepID=M5U9C7_9BACT|nr:tryptophan halogenase family protein [Rhodopirellula sallentina]EMI57889.1 tryptophan halogenase PrnA [Rhodopirellula sallentina SM41]